MKVIFIISIAFLALLTVCIFCLGRWLKKDEGSKSLEFVVTLWITVISVAIGVFWGIWGADYATTQTEKSYLKTLIVQMQQQIPEQITNIQGEMAELSKLDSDTRHNFDMFLKFEMLNEFISTPSLTKYCQKEFIDIAAQRGKLERIYWKESWFGSFYNTPQGTKSIEDYINGLKEMNGLLDKCKETL